MKPTILHLLLGIILGAGPLLAQQEPSAPAKKPIASPQEKAPDPEVVEWVRMLAERMVHPNEAIRSSAHEALLRLGKLAMPQLKDAAEGNDALRARAAKDVIAKMEQRRAKQEGGHDGKRPPNDVLENRFVIAAKAANLTPEQEVKVKAHFEEQRTKTQDLFAQARDGVLTKEEVRAALQNLEKESRTALKAFLDEAQAASFMEAMQKVRPAGPSRRGGEGDK
ncbi:MAG: hypothetical protein EXS14_06815 [Planctomycetes bacterium]|nr:hypothetical protein [Planctomycetota bacterium]